MLKTLIKKQLMEIFRMYLYDTKKNRSRSKGKILFSFILFGILMVVVLGGMFAGLAAASCAPLSELGMSWIYFMLFGLLSIFMGAFGSVFNTYSGLYLSKDNDFLLSLPIPVRTIMTARLTSVYLMGLMYSAVVSLPAVIVYLCVAPFTVSALIGGIVYVFMISLFVMVLSCALGWVVAKISLKLKNRSFITVFISLACIGLYYFFYYKAQEMIADLVANAAVYGTAIRANFQPLYVFGNAATGDWGSMALLSAFTLILFVVTSLALEKSFLSIATATGKTDKAVYHEKRAKLRSVSGAMLSKEFRRFTSSPNYMLNCGLSALFLPIAAIAMILKGGALIDAVKMMFGGDASALPILLAAAICLVASMNDCAAPSVSLEGKNLWLAQSLPVSAWTSLRAKLRVQLIITLPGVALCGVSAAILCPGNVLERAMIVVFPIVFCVLTALIGLSVGLKTANVNWTNELMPVKQSLGVFIALFGSWLLSIAFGGLWFLAAGKMSGSAYMLIATLVALIPAVLLYRWLKIRGAKAFAEL